MRSIVTVVVMACLMAPSCRTWALFAGAPPQARSAWADSTHITGLAERIAPLPTAQGGDPRTIQELLDRMDGAELYFHEFLSTANAPELPALWRVVVTSAGARVEEFVGGWQVRCTLSPMVPYCGAQTFSHPVNLVHEISANGITIGGASCVYQYPYYASFARAGAVYTWAHYANEVGKFSNVDRFLRPWENGYSGYWFQAGSYEAQCPDYDPYY
jgi:hypothetical protein